MVFGYNKNIIFMFTMSRIYISYLIYFVISYISVWRKEKEKDIEVTVLRFKLRIYSNDLLSYKAYLYLITLIFYLYVNGTYCSLIIYFCIYLNRERQDSIINEYLYEIFPYIKLTIEFYSIRYFRYITHNIF